MKRSVVIAHLSVHDGHSACQLRRALHASVRNIPSLPCRWTFSKTLRRVWEERVNTKTRGGVVDDDSIAWSCCGALRACSRNSALGSGAAWTAHVWWRLMRVRRSRRVLDHRIGDP